VNILIFMNAFNSNASRMFSYIPQVLGPTWFAMGTGTSTSGGLFYSISAYDNSNVYIGGGFIDVGGDTFKRCIAKWDGTTWQRMGTGTPSTVRGIRAYDNSNVYVAGQFSDIGGDTFKRGTAKWDGTTWQRLGNGIGVSATGVSIIDNSNIYFASSGILKWNGTSYPFYAGIASSTEVFAVDNSNVYA
jgi:hypothetical protein